MKKRKKRLKLENKIKMKHGKTVKKNEEYKEP